MIHGEVALPASGAWAKFSVAGLVHAAPQFLAVLPSKVLWTSGVMFLPIHGGKFPLGFADT